MVFENKTSKFYSKSELRIALTFSTALLAIGTVQEHSSGFANVQAQSNNSTITTTTTTTAKPVYGYNTPQGHLSAIRYVFDDPAIRVQHYCKPNDKIVLVCQIYDRVSPNVTLIGIEYIITADQYKALPDREKLNWHYHAIEFATNRADPMFPELDAAQVKAVTGKLMDTQGKVILTWNPKDKLPIFTAQAKILQHPFMVNQTITLQMDKYAAVLIKH